MTVTLLTVGLLAAAVPPEYRTFFGLNPRLTVWIIAELHNLFATFVLSVPIFALVIEIVGARAENPETRERYDRLAFEFVKLLSSAFATTAALGGFLAFVLFSTYPRFMAHLTDTYHPTFYVYTLLFFAETSILYSYYYSWNHLQGVSKNMRLRRAGGAALVVSVAYLLAVWIGILPMGQAWTVFAVFGASLLGLGAFCAGYGRKGSHIYLGALLNVTGMVIMLIANSWVTYMMSPPGLAEGAAGKLDSHWSGTNYTGSLAEAFFNELWMPINVHRILVNCAFGGAVCAAYAAIRFLAARSAADKAHYDWMGYVGNFTAILSIIPLPFAGYWLGREIYSFNPTMGQDLMGGAFSWTFILQASLVGTIFITGNYYIWSGMQRIPGGERYEKFVPWMVGILFICFAVWLTPHNLPLGGLEKKFGLMPAKNAVIQLMILTTSAGFLMYRRANKARSVSVSASGLGGRVAVVVAAGGVMAFLWSYSASADLSDSNPEVARFLVEKLPLAFLQLDVGGKLSYAATLRWTLYLQIFWVVVCSILVFRDRGKLAQGLLIGVTSFHASFWLFQHGFTIMEKANPLVRQVAVCQVLMTLSCLILATVFDILLYRGAPNLEPFRWGKMHRRSQYALLLLCVVFVMNMGLMGFIRSGLRKEWHVVAVLKDTSEWAATPSNLYMATTVSGITFVFIVMVAFVFWTASLVEPGRQKLTGNSEFVSAGDLRTRDPKR